MVCPLPPIVYNYRFFLICMHKGCKIQQMDVSTFDSMLLRVAEVPSHADDAYHKCLAKYGKEPYSVLVDHDQQQFGSNLRLKGA